MTEKRPLGLPSAKLVAIAVVTGIIAGAAAVYVKETGSGNAVVSADATECAPSVAQAEALKPLTRGEVAAMTAVTEPRKLTNFVFNDVDNESLSLSDFKGKTLLFNLWATWCVPCREEMPALNNLQKEMGDDNFQVVAVNIDNGDADKPKAFMAETGVDSLGLYRDSSMGVFNDLKKEGLAFGLPVTLLVNEKGCLLGSMNGPAEWDSNDAKALIAAAKAN